jgi:hypothetical protein
MLDARFPTYTPGSRRLAEFELAGDHQQLVDEIDRTGRNLPQPARRGSPRASSPMARRSGST